MKCFVLLTVLAFASENENDAESVTANSVEKIMTNAAEDSIMVKIEEDECDKKKNESSSYIGVNKRSRKWIAQRWSRKEKKMFFNGTYKNEETAAHASDTLARKLIAIGEEGHKINFPDDNAEVYPDRKKNTGTSEYVGVIYDQERAKWRAIRRSKNKNLHNGHYKDEETAAHASDTLARKLIADGKNHKLNFPDDKTEVYPKNNKNSKHRGVFYLKSLKRWYATRWSKIEKKSFYNGVYKDEETAAHASDSLVRKLIANGENGHKLNFPNVSKEVNALTKSSKYFGVFYRAKAKLWITQRWSKIEKKTLTNGYYRAEETAAHASDTLARKLMKNGEQNHKLNFPDEINEVCAKTYQTKKRKRSFDKIFQTNESNSKKFEEKER